MAKAEAFGRHFYTPDALGSSRIVTNLSGVVEQKCAYYPFGSQLTDSGTAVTNYKYTGKEWDGEEGLYYYGARYYDPEIGRFYSIDPMGGPAASPYAYCNNNPMNFVDPTGMVAAYPSGWYQVFGDRYSAYDAWKYMQPVSDVPDDNGGQLSPTAGWTDASGAPVDIAMNPWATSPERMYLEVMLNKAANDPAKAEEICRQLQREGFNVSVSKFTYTNGELTGSSTKKYYTENDWGLCAGPGAGVSSVAEERLKIFQVIGQLSANLYKEHGSTGNFLVGGMITGDLQKWYTGDNNVFACTHYQTEMYNALTGMGLKFYTPHMVTLGVHQFVTLTYKGHVIIIDPYMYQPIGSGFGW